MCTCLVEQSDSAATLPASVARCRWGGHAVRAWSSRAHTRRHCRRPWLDSERQSCRGVHAHAPGRAGRTRGGSAGVRWLGSERAAGGTALIVGCSMKTIINQRISFLPAHNRRADSASDRLGVCTAIQNGCALASSGATGHLRQLFGTLKADYALMVQAYFDESGTHRGSSVTCVAGYLFDSDQCLRLNDEWKSALDDFGIAHFHMADCAGGGGLFRGRSVVERDDLARKLIGIIKRRALIGVVASVRPEDHAKMATAQMAEQGGSYILCLLWCIAGVAAWVHKHSYSGSIAYFFEAGHRLQAREIGRASWR